MTYTPNKKIGKEPEVKGLPVSFAIVVFISAVLGLILLISLSSVSIIIALIVGIGLPIVTLRFTRYIYKKYGGNIMCHISFFLTAKNIRFNDPFVFKKLTKK